MPTVKTDGNVNIDKTVIDSVTLTREYEGAMRYCVTKWPLVGPNPPESAWFIGNSQAESALLEALWERDAPDHMKGASGYDRRFMSRCGSAWTPQTVDADHAFHLRTLSLEHNDAHVDAFGSHWLIRMWWNADDRLDYWLTLPAGNVEWGLKYIRNTMDGLARAEFEVLTSYERNVVAPAIEQAKAARAASGTRIEVPGCADSMTLEDPDTPVPATWRYDFRSSAGRDNMGQGNILLRASPSDDHAMLTESVHGSIRGAAMVALDRAMRETDAPVEHLTGDEIWNADERGGNPHGMTDTELGSLDMLCRIRRGTASGIMEWRSNGDAVIVDGNTTYKVAAGTVAGLLAELRAGGDLNALIRNQMQE